MSISTFKPQCTCGVIAAHQRIVDLILDTQIDPMLANGLCGLSGACHPVRDVQLERTTSVSALSVHLCHACLKRANGLTHASHHTPRFHRWVGAASSPSSSPSSPWSSSQGHISRASGPAPATTTEARVHIMLAWLAKSGVGRPCCSLCLGCREGLDTRGHLPRAPFYLFSARV